MEHECGIVGIIGKDNIIPNLISGLHQLQHRGYESCGISYLKIPHNDIITYKNIGLVEDVFKDFDLNIISNTGIGHVRYSTAKKDKSKFLEESQPLSNKIFSMAHNGNIPFIQKIKEYYHIETDNNSDSTILMKFMEYLMSTKFTKIEEMLKYIINNVTGVYSLVILTPNGVYALRDRFGVRPLVILDDKLNQNTFITSESVAFQNKDTEIVQNINPGEIISITRDQKITSIYTHPLPQPMFCSFEYIYFMHHESIQDDRKIEDIRYSLGHKLGLSEKEVLSDSVVMAIPNSSIPASKGFADAINSVFKQHIIKNPTVKRTFILPTEKERNNACAKKFNFVDTDELCNKNIYLIDDSIVRGTTIKFVINQLKQFHPKTINVRITSPPVTSPCYFGIDMSTREELIINKKNINSITKELNINSLRYLDIDDMSNIFNKPVCKSCFTGDYNSKLLDW